MHALPLRLVLVSLIPLFCSAGPTLAENSWPQWQGPERNGLNDEKGLLQEWPEGGPKQLWMSQEAGAGYAGPAIVAGKLYTMGSKEGQEQLLAFDVNNGDLLWSAPIDRQAEHGWGVGPQGTPTVDGDRVYALGSQGTLVCVSAADGKEAWRVTMQDLGGKQPQWKFAESPLVDGDLVLCTPGGEQGAIAALDKLSGDVRWQTESLKDGAHYTSPIVAMLNGQKQYVHLLNEHLVGLAPADGAVLWQTSWPGAVATIPTPIASGNKVYATCGYGVGCKLVEIGPDNTVSEVYANKSMKNKHGGVILLDGALYGHSDGVGWDLPRLRDGRSVVARTRGAGDGRHRLRRRPLLLCGRGNRRRGADRGLPRRVVGARPIHPYPANQEPLAEGPHLDPRRGGQRPSLPARSGDAVLLRRAG